ncbi:MAG: hypothetical protein ACP5HT_06775 [Conexivisphaera sp.]|jgi:tellurite resistance protein TehA-like permease
MPTFRLMGIFSSDWFSVALGTTAASVAVYWLSALTRSPALRALGIVLAALGAMAFLVISVLWAVRGMAFPELVRRDAQDLGKVSFTALIPLELIALGVALQLYFGVPRGAAVGLLEADYFAAFALAISLSVFEGYLLYTKSVAGKELTYAILVPPISVSTDVLLASTMMQVAPDMRPLVAAFTLWGLGISFMLFIFIGSLALAAHVREIRTPESVPIAIFPVGVSSILVMNVLFASSLGFLSPRPALMISLALWGYEAWNVLVMAVVSARSLHGRPPMSVWAYLFPLTIFWVSSIRISAMLNSIGYMIPSRIVLVAGAATGAMIIPLWAYSVYATASLLSWLTSLPREAAPKLEEGEDVENGGKETSP